MKLGFFVATSVLLVGCGGGGGGGPAPTKATVAPTLITAMVAPLVAPVGIAAALPGTTMLSGPNTIHTQPAIVQSADYTLDLAAASAFPSSIQLTTVNVKAVDTTTGSITITTGAAQPLDPALGQTTGITVSVGGLTTSLSTVTGSVAIGSNITGISADVLTDPLTGTTAGFAQPYSAVMNPSGYIYQTFGLWMTVDPVTGVISENYFSTGSPSSGAALPATGSARYNGRTSGTLVDAATRNMSDVSAAMNATANFATRSVSFTTSGSTSLSVNAPLAALPAPNPGLNMTGTLTYTAGSNTFSGPVSSVNGMSGNATGRFYGPGVMTATPNLTAGSPPEIGGTFALSKPGVSAVWGVFGGTGNNPPVVVPLPTSITGVATPPPAPLVGTTNIIANMATPPNSFNVQVGIVQGMNYTVGPAPSLGSYQPITSLNMLSVDTAGMFAISTGIAAYPLDPTLGQPIAITLTTGAMGFQWVAPALGNTAVFGQANLAGLPSITSTNANGSVAEYVMPYSTTMSPSGYTYQTFGHWTPSNLITPSGEYYFSAGVPTNSATLPILGTASYTGQAIGSMVDSMVRDLSKIVATMNATADFATRTVVFSTTGTTTLPSNAAPGALPTANAGLNMTGTLSYATGNNTFTGAVTTTNGMTGSATGRFYGPGIAAATPTKVVGAPPEIGGTFAVMKTGAGAMAMQGAFGGK